MAAGHGSLVYIDVMVDGNDLGYHKIAKPGGSAKLFGAWGRKDGVSTTTSLRFDKPTISALAAGTADGRRSMIFGRGGAT